MASTEDLTRDIVDQLTTFDKSSLSELYLDSKGHISEFHRLAEQELDAIENAKDKMREETERLDALIEKEKLIHKYLDEARLQREVACAQALRQAAENSEISASTPQLIAAQKDLANLQTELHDLQLKRINLDQNSGLTSNEVREARWVRILETLPINPEKVDVSPEDFWRALEELCLPTSEDTNI